MSDVSVMGIMCKQHDDMTRLWLNIYQNFVEGNCPGSILGII
jgi:hypothetical protein